MSSGRATPRSVPRCVADAPTVKAAKVYSYSVDVVLCDCCDEVSVYVMLGLGLGDDVRTAVVSLDREDIPDLVDLIQAKVIAEPLQSVDRGAKAKIDWHLTKAGKEATGL